MKTAIADGIQRAFTQARAVAEAFAVHQSNFLTHQTTDVHSFSTASVDQLRLIIAQYHADIALISSLPTSSPVGILSIDTAGLKAKYLPQPKLRLSEVEKLIPQIAREQCKILLDKLRDAQSKISAIPATVEQFVSLMSFLTVVHDSEDADNASFSYLNDLYVLMSDSKLRIADTDKAMLERVSQLRSQFRTALVLSEAAINANTERFSKELESAIPALASDVKAMNAQLQFEDIHRVDADELSVIEYLTQKSTETAELESRASKFAYYQSVLNVDVSAFEEVKALRVDVDTKLALWHAVRDWASMSQSWIKCRFDCIDVDDIARNISSITKVVSRAKRSMESSLVIQKLKANIDSFKETLPVVSDLRLPTLQRHHWEQIHSLFHHEIQSDANFTLGTLIALNATAHKNAIAQIANSANNESKLVAQLNKVIELWTTITLTVVPHRDCKDVYILGALDDVSTALDESLVSIASISASRYVEPIRESVDEWNNKLMTLFDTLDEWTMVQRQWIYLETIFSSADIIRQLPEEYALFNKVDRAFKDLMRRTNDQPNAIIAGCAPQLFDSLTTYNVWLDKVQKQLESYLETRRQAFPRFYFLSNDELLKILAQSKSVANVIPHLRKCFDNILDLDYVDRDIKAMISSEGERVALGSNMKARGPAEAWLPALEADMIKSLRRAVKRGLTDYHKANRRSDWVLDKIGQVVSVVSQIVWSERM